MDEELKESIEKFKSHVTPENVTRKVIKFVAQHSVGFVAATLAKTYCPTENKKEQLQLTVGAYVIGGMAGNTAADWAEREFDEAIEFIKKVYHGVKLKQSDSKETTPKAEPTE